MHAESRVGPASTHLSSHASLVLPGSEQESNSVNARCQEVGEVTQEIFAAERGLGGSKITLMTCCQISSAKIGIGPSEQ
jgi:hypothetical protein